MTLRFGKFTEEEMIIQSLLYVCLLHGKMKKHHQHLQFVKSMNLYLNADVVINFNKQNEKKKNELGFTSSSHVFLWADDGGTQPCPFSREFSIARMRALDNSCLTRLFLAVQPKVEGDSEPVTSIT
jgi:hypothetical protein